LRQRIDDIKELAEHHLTDLCDSYSVEPKEVSSEFFEVLHTYGWPGNVRELKNLIERLVIMTPDQTINLSDLPHAINKETAGKKAGGAHLEELPDSYREAKELFEKQFLLQKLQKNSWNVSRTAEEIGLERSNLHRKIKSYGIETDKP